MELDNYETLAGIPIIKAFQMLDDPLPPDAYKAIIGGKGQKLDLTDIKPAYLPELLARVFGPVGVGWGFELRAMQSERGKTSGGHDVWESRCNVAIWYRYVDKRDSKTYISDSQEVSGGSDNSEREWAEKGAITNALGTAWFFAGYQISVFKGLRSHRTEATGSKVQQEAARLVQAPSRSGPSGDGVHNVAALVNSQLSAAKTGAPMASKKQLDELTTHLKAAGITKDTIAAFLTQNVGRTLTTIKNLHSDEADALLLTLMSGKPNG